MNDVALKLRTLMKERRMSQEELGRIVGKSQSAVKHWLSHHGPPTRLLPAIEAALEVAPGTLLKAQPQTPAPLAQELISLLQQGAFSEDELEALLKFSKVFAKSQEVYKKPASIRPLQVSPFSSIRPRATAGKVVALYAPGSAAASAKGRDWFDPLDEPPQVEVAVDSLKWVSQVQALDPKRHYVLMVEGDSMEPLIPENALVVVAHHETPRVGYPNVVAWQEGGEGRVAIKHLKQEEGGLMCLSLNPDHAPFVLGHRQQPQVRGFVVAVLPGDH